MIFKVTGEKGEQHLDNEECIQVFEVEINKLMEFICNKVQNEGYGIASEVYSLACGIEFNKIFE